MEISVLNVLKKGNVVFKFSPLHVIVGKSGQKKLSCQINIFFHNRWCDLDYTRAKQYTSCCIKYVF